MSLMPNREQEEMNKMFPLKDCRTMSAQQTNWTEYKGTDEQIAEMENAARKGNGFITSENVNVWTAAALYVNNLSLKTKFNNIKHYWICNPHPLADMIIRQAQTGRPVWIKMKSSTYWAIAMRGFDLVQQDHIVSVIKSTTPDWNIPNAEYSFTEFEEVEK